MEMRIRQNRAMVKIIKKHEIAKFEIAENLHYRKNELDSFKSQSDKKIESLDDLNLNS